MSRRLLWTGIVVVTMAIPSVAAAQSDPGATRVGSLFGGSLAASHSAPTFGFSLSQRLSKDLAIEGEVARLSDLTLVESQPAIGSWHARATSATANLTYTLPMGVRRVRSYLVAGGGAASVTRSVLDAPVCPCASTQYVKPVAAAGAGFDVLMGHGVAIGLDFRYLRVFEDDSLYRPNLRAVKRVGTSISYRF